MNRTSRAALLAFFVIWAPLACSPEARTFGTTGEPSSSSGGGAAGAAGGMASSSSSTSGTGGGPSSSGTGGAATGGADAGGPMPCDAGDTCPLTQVCEDGYCLDDGDGDGFSDAFEIACGSHPMQEGSQPDPAVLMGSGTPQEPYRLCLPDHVYAIGSSAMFNGASFLVTRDLDLTKATNPPTSIGSAAGGFVGHFDGGGHTLSGLVVVLIPNLGAGSVVENLKLVAVNINGQGAIAAQSSGLVKNVSVAGQVTYGDHAGAVVGTNQMMGVVTGCSSTGDVGQGNHTGGVVGSNSGLVDESWSSSTVSGGSRTGGLVGSNFGTVSRSFFTGKVTGNGTDTGGLVGTMFSGKLSDDYVQCVSVNGSQNGGGLVGGMGGAGEIARCYAVCPVNGQGLIGLGGAMATITSSYWNIDVAPMGSFGAGKTSTQLGMQSTFVGWDFAATWKFAAALGAYPVLAWQ